MTANVMVQQHGNSHHTALQQTTAHKQQQTSGPEALWFSRFLSRKSRKISVPGPTVSVASVPAESPPITPTDEVTVELKDGSEQIPKEPFTINKRTLAKKQSEGHLTLAPTKSASQTLKSKRSFNFMAHRKPSTSALSTKAATTESQASSQQPSKKSVPYVPRHAGSDFSQVAIPTTYRDSYASMYISGSDRRPSSSTTPPPQEREVRHYASVGNVSSATVPNDGPVAAGHGSRSQRPMVFLTEAEDIPEEGTSPHPMFLSRVSPHASGQPLQTKKSFGRKRSTAQGGEQQPGSGSLFEKFVSDGLEAAPKHHHKQQPHIAIRAQSTPDIRAAASAKGPASMASSSSKKLYAKYREHQQQHAPQNTIFTVPEYGREASRPSSSTNHSVNPPAQSRQGSSIAPSQGHIVPRKLSRRESSASIGTHRSGRAGSTSGSTHGEQAMGMSSFSRKLSEYIKPAALSAEGKGAAAQHSFRRPSYKAQGIE
ncbi:hypothetical protein F503_06043 [Ophiostoma piceae UAMH 11346]|uniref:Uncharacterized protein n=1 Tax=Ophiostoma piceae (strain UAMH 11346) TaxID=1262450 RepID=S3CW49_OPHP1|nr:hypothetical protein F503_06043 [Ophiostoma piceae UAMH 11346]